MKRSHRRKSRRRSRRTRKRRGGLTPRTDTGVFKSGDFANTSWLLAYLFLLLLSPSIHLLAGVIDL